MDGRIIAIVERELGEPPEWVEEVALGLLHETYVVRSGGAAYVLQFSSDADDDREDSLERGLGCYVLLGDSGIPVPDAVTDTVREFDGREYALVERLPGETGERNVLPEKTRNAGRCLARIHGFGSFDTAGLVRFEDGEPVVEAHSNGLSERMRTRVEEAAETFEEAGLERVGRKLRRVGGWADRLSDGFDPVLCHGDYSPDNVLFEDGEVTGILDFDRAWVGRDHRDLVHAANAFWMHDPNANWDVRTAFYEGYQDVRDTGDAFERNEPLYRVVTLADTVSGMLELGELSAYEREFYDERLLEAVARLEER